MGRVEGRLGGYSREKSKSYWACFRGMGWRRRRGGVVGDTVRREVGMAGCMGGGRGRGCGKERKKRAEWVRWRSVHNSVGKMAIGERGATEINKNRKYRRRCVPECVRVPLVIRRNLQSQKTRTGSLRNGTTYHRRLATAAILYKSHLRTRPTIAQNSHNIVIKDKW